MSRGSQVTFLGKKPTEKSKHFISRMSAITAKEALNEGDEGPVGVYMEMTPNKWVSLVRKFEKWKS